jgi:tetratricopeptide (TPR) repeat protein
MKSLTPDYKIEALIYVSLKRMLKGQRKKGSLVLSDTIQLIRKREDSFPSNASLLAEAASVYVQIKQKRKAIKILSEALGSRGCKYASTRVTSFKDIALVYGQLGYRKKASDLLSRAFRLATTDKTLPRQFAILNEHFLRDVVLAYAEIGEYIRAADIIKKMKKWGMKPSFTNWDSDDIADNAIKTKSFPISLKVAQAIAYMKQGDHHKFILMNKYLKAKEYLWAIKIAKIFFQNRERKNRALAKIAFQYITDHKKIDEKGEKILRAITREIYR